MRTTAAIVIGLGLLAGGCAALPGSSPRTTPTTAVFDVREVAWAAQPGANAVRGRAFIDPGDGETRTCAGAVVALLPDSSYTRERMLNLYGSLDRGVNNMAHGAAQRLDPADPAYVKAARQSTCDVRGGFAFNNVPDGVWYVTTSVVWRTRGNDPTSQQGAGLMQRVTLSGGRHQTLTLTR